MSDAKPPFVGAAATATFRETFDDEEAEDSVGNGTSDPSGQGSGRARVGLLAGSLALLLLFVVALSVGLATRGYGAGKAGADVTDAIPPTSTPPAPPPNSAEADAIFLVNEASEAPSTSPSAQLSTEDPSFGPSNGPSGSPSASPSWDPTSAPTGGPTAEPSKAPTLEPTSLPSKEPSCTPSRLPTLQPSTTPSRRPTNKPTIDLSKWVSIFATPKPSPSLTHMPTLTYFGGELVADRDLGIRLSRGLSARIIARTGRRVQYAYGGESRLRFHSQPDAAGIVPMNPIDPLADGYAYVSNSEESGGEGGVYAIYFDRDGVIVDYRALLTGTSRNCGGGHTSWNTWISCEEYNRGQCWQIDPYNMKADATRLGGNNGGRYESVACDDRDPDMPVFFTTEDKEEGALRRFVATGQGWDVLHADGDESFLNMLGDGTFQWTKDERLARRSAARYYPKSEGVQVHAGKLYFMPKSIQKLIVLDLERMTYWTERTGKKFYGEGDFGSQPDQNLFGPTKKYMYFTEDGGSSPGVYGRFHEDGTYFTLFQAIAGGIHNGDETIGIALSPDHKRFYAGFQDSGMIFEITRNDGLPFE